MNFGGDAILPEWAEQSTAMDIFEEARKGLYDDQGWTIGTTEEFNTDLNKAKRDAIEQLISEYTQSGEFEYPDPGMVYGYDDYMGSREMVPGYELGQGLDIGSLRPIQPAGVKPMSELGLPATMDWQRQDKLTLDELIELGADENQIAQYLGVA